MKYKSTDIIISTSLLFEITDDNDTINMFLNIALKTCYKYLPLIKKSLSNHDNDLLFKSAHEISGISSIGIIAIVNISDDFVKLSENDKIDINLGMKYFVILEKEINNLQKWILNYSKIN